MSDDYIYSVSPFIKVTMINGYYSTKVLFCHIEFGAMYIQNLSDTMSPFSFMSRKASR